MHITYRRINTQRSTRRKIDYNCFLAFSFLVLINFLYSCSSDCCDHDYTICEVALTRRATLPLIAMHHSHNLSFGQCIITKKPTTYSDYTNKEDLFQLIVRTHSTDCQLEQDLSKNPLLL